MNWGVATARELLELADPGVWGPEDANGGISVLRSTNFLNDGRLDLTNLSFRRIANGQRFSKLLMAGDIILERSGGSPRQPVGRVCFFPGDSRAHTFSNFCQRLRANASLCEARYLFWYLYHVQTTGGTLRFQKQTTGIRNLDYAGYLQQPVPLPPMSEQRRIIQILDQVDRLRHLRSETDARADRILPALFIKMFGDPATNPMNWRTAPLRHLAILGPQYGANAPSKPLEAGGPRYVRITDILPDGSLSEEAVGIDAPYWEPYVLNDGDLLFARSGATVGKTYIHRSRNGSCVFAGYLIRFRLDASVLHPLVAFAFTQTPAYRTWVEGKRRTAAQPNINGQEYASLVLPVPDRNTQASFVRAYSALERNVQMSASATSATARLFKAMLNNAFAGSLTAAWRQSHAMELLREQELQGSARAARQRDID